MPKVINFNGRQIIEPGAYARTLGAVEKAIEGASFGSVLIIDTGNLSSAYGWGSGVNGEKDQNLKSVYAFESLNSFQTAIGGGVLWDIARFLFKPARDIGVAGVERVLYVKAATTTAASVDFVPTGGGSDGGSITFKTVVEGTAGNGVENSNEGNGLSAGFGITMAAGVLDTSKFKLQFWRGTYRGLDTTVTPNVLINNIAETDAVPELIVESPEFDNIQTLIDWANTNETFLSWFYISASTVTGTGDVDAADLAANSTLAPFSGGSVTADGDDMDAALAAVQEEDYTFVMTDYFGAEATDTNNDKVLSHIVNEAVYEKFLVVGGGRDADTFNDPLDVADQEHSVQIAQYYDSARVYVVHSDIEARVLGGSGTRKYSVFYHAAMALGRMAGVEPQVPITWADIDVTGVIHEMGQRDREIAVQSGVMHLRYVEERGGYVVNLDQNTLQSNEDDILPDGTSYHGSIMRITSLLNKELVKECRRRFIAMNNVNTASPEDVRVFVETYLAQRTALATEDNLILSFQNVTVQVNGSDYEITYGFVPNGPVSRFFITGFMLPISLSA